MSAYLGIKKDIELTKAIYLPVKTNTTKAVPLHGSLLNVLIQVGSGSLMSLLHTHASFAIQSQRLVPLKSCDLLSGRMKKLPLASSVKDQRLKDQTL